MRNKYSLRRRLLREAEEEEGAGLDSSYDDAVAEIGEPAISNADMANPEDASGVPDDMIDDADDIFDAIEGEET